MRKAEVFYRFKFFFCFDAFRYDAAIERDCHILNWANKIKFDRVIMEAVNKVLVNFYVFRQQFRPES